MRTASEVAAGFRIVIQPDSAALRAVPGMRMADAIATLARYPSADQLADGRLVSPPFAPGDLGAPYRLSVLADLRGRGRETAFIPVLLGWRREARSFAPPGYAMSAWGERDVNAIEGGGFRGFFAAMTPYTLRMTMPLAPQDVLPKVSRFWEMRNTSAFRLL
ncbi:MAG: hypothetical protein M0002_21025 [Rhodospirillales bacterium]|nr:hypothetical protein [Rhodospirillales bacterium]